MSAQACNDCGGMFRDGERAVATFAFPFRVLKSKIAFMVHPHDLEYLEGTLRHDVCPEEVTA